MNILGKHLYTRDIDFDQHDIPGVSWSGTQPLILNGYAEIDGPGSMSVELNGSPQSFFSAWLFQVSYSGELLNKLSIQTSEEEGVISIKMNSTHITIKAIPPLSGSRDKMSVYNIALNESSSGCPRGTSGRHSFEVMYHVPTSTIVIACDGYFVGNVILQFSIIPGRLKLSWNNSIRIYDVSINAYDLAAQRHVFRNSIFADFGPFLLDTSKINDTNETFVFYLLSQDLTTRFLLFYGPGEYTPFMVSLRGSENPVLERANDTFYLLDADNVSKVMIGGRGDGSHLSSLEGYLPSRQFRVANMTGLSDLVIPFGSSVSKKGVIAYSMFVPVIQLSTGLGGGPILVRYSLAQSLTIVSNNSVETPLIVSTTGDPRLLQASASLISSLFTSSSPVSSSNSVAWISNDTVAMVVPILGMIYLFNTTSNAIGVVQVNQSMMLVSINDTSVGILDGRGLEVLDPEKLWNMSTPLAHVESGDFLLVDGEMIPAPQDTLIYNATLTLFMSNGNIAWTKPGTWRVQAWDPSILFSWVQDLTGEPVVQPNQTPVSISLIPADGTFYLMITGYGGVNQSSPFLYELNPGLSTFLFRLITIKFGEENVSPIDCFISLPLRGPGGKLLQGGFASVAGYASIGGYTLLEEHVFPSYLFIHNESQSVPPTPEITFLSTILKITGNHNGSCNTSLLGITRSNDWILSIIDGRFYSTRQMGNNLTVEEAGPASFVFPQQINVSDGFLRVKLSLNPGNGSCLMAGYTPQCLTGPIPFNQETNHLTLYSELGGNNSVTYIFTLSPPNGGTPPGTSDQQNNNTLNEGSGGGGEGRGWTWKLLGVFAAVSAFLVAFYVYRVKKKVLAKPGRTVEHVGAPS